MKTNQQILDEQVSETELVKDIIYLAHFKGWRVAHFRPAQTNRTYIRKDGTKGQIWVTPVQADGEGFPDLILLRGNCLVALEVKSEKGKTSLAQENWLVAFSQIRIGKSGTVKPHDWQTIIEILE